MAGQNRNPTGTNQYGAVAKADDPSLVAALNTLHREKVTNNKKISERLKSEYGISMSATSVKRRRKELGLSGSGATSRIMPEQERRQLVIREMDTDLSRQSGVHTIQQKIAFNHGIHLTRDFVSEVMHVYDREGFSLREPTAKKIKRFPKIPLGIHERWAGDGHDKLYKIGYPIWAVVDDAIPRWLNGWVVPSNRRGDVVCYLFLCLVEQYGGIPLQMATDHGSETTQMYGMMNALRTTFHPHLDNNELPAYVYLPSVHNISIERSWRRLRADFGDNAVMWYMKGVDLHNFKPENPQHYELSRWLWSKLLNQELQAFMNFRNGARMRKDKNKPGPSGMSRNEAFALPGSWGGEDFLLPIPIDVVRRLKEEVGGEDLLKFVSDEFADEAETAWVQLGIGKVTFENVWHVFKELFALIFPDAVY